MLQQRKVKKKHAATCILLQDRTMRPYTPTKQNNQPEKTQLHSRQAIRKHRTKKSGERPVPASVWYARAACREAGSRWGLGVWKAEGPRQERDKLVMAVTKSTTQRHHQQLRARSTGPMPRTARVGPASQIRTRRPRTITRNESRHGQPAHTQLTDKARQCLLSARLK